MTRGSGLLTKGCFRQPIVCWHKGDCWLDTAILIVYHFFLVFCCHSQTASMDVALFLYFRPRLYMIICNIQVYKYCSLRTISFILCPTLGLQQASWMEWNVSQPLALGETAFSNASKRVTKRKREKKIIQNVKEYSQPPLILKPYVAYLSKTAPCRNGKWWS